MPAPTAPDSDATDAGSAARDWIARLASGDPSAADLAGLRAWLAADAAHRTAFARERALWRDLGTIEQAFGECPDAGDVAVPAPRRRRHLHLAGLVLAASFATWMALPQLSIWLQADHRSPATATSRIVLPDGSTAVLDAGSAVAVAFDADQRRIELLEGRAWFEVAHGDARPFLVAAAGGTTHDIGTAFAVDRSGDIVVVGVSEGAVAVTGADGESLRLNTAQQAGYGTDGSAHRLADLPPGAIAAWRNGELLLRNMPLDRAIAEIASYRTAPVFALGEMGKAPPVSGAFRIDRPDDALATLVEMRRLGVMKLPGGLLVLRAE